MFLSNASVFVLGDQGRSTERSELNLTTSSLRRNRNKGKKLAPHEQEPGGNSLKKDVGKKSRSKPRPDKQPIPDSEDEKVIGARMACFHLLDLHQCRTTGSTRKPPIGSPEKVEAEAQRTTLCRHRYVEEASAKPVRAL